MSLLKGFLELRQVVLALEHLSFLLCPDLLLQDLALLQQLPVPPLGLQQVLACPHQGLVVGDDVVDVTELQQRVPGSVTPCLALPSFPCPEQSQGLSSWKIFSSPLSLLVPEHRGHVIPWVMTRSVPGLGLAVAQGKCHSSAPGDLGWNTTAPRPQDQGSSRSTEDAWRDVPASWRGGPAFLTTAWVPFLGSLFARLPHHQCDLGW